MRCAHLLSAERVADLTQTLILHGVCTIEVKQGSVTVSGASFFPPTSFPLFSPSLASLPVLRATSKTELELRSLRTGIEGVNPLLYLSDFIGRTESVWTSASSQRLLPSALGFDIVRPFAYLQSKA